MKLGTKSLLFGVHQVIWHPITVYKAWVELYGSRPDWKTSVCILIHDWGYWGKPDMDGEKGERHPEVGAKIAGWLFGRKYHNLVLYHSRHYARNAGVTPSKLCWPDKLSHIYEPAWWYLFRARLSGELKEYRKTAAESGFLPLTASDQEWFAKLQAYFRKLGEEQRGDAVQYMNPRKEF